MRSETHTITRIMLKISAFAIGVACVFGSPALASSGSRAAQTSQESKAVKLDPRTYSAYVGQYELAPAFIITVRKGANRLSIQATNQPEFEIFAESETKFFLTVVDITFVKNDKGEVTYLILHQGGIDQRARKISSTAPPDKQAGSSPAARAPIDSPVEMVVPLAPTTVKGDGKIHPAYELHLTNFGAAELTLARLEVLGSDGQPLAQYDGAEALAVADATVVAVKDGIPENIPGANSRAVPITLETVGGNYVILDLKGGYYAFYAHLQPGSLRVKAGDKVKRGQVLGLVGNSGNSTEPHLHFHISDANSPLGSEGLPYVFESFEVQGKGWGWKSSGKDTAEKRAKEIPLEDMVVRFPAVR